MAVQVLTKVLTPVVSGGDDDVIVAVDRRHTRGGESDARIVGEVEDPFVCL